MIVLKIGNQKDLDKRIKTEWTGYSEGYFESERHAEKYLIDKGYEKDTDDVFFKETEIISNVILLARIVDLPKIDVKF